MVAVFADMLAAIQWAAGEVEALLEKAVAEDLGGWSCWWAVKAQQILPSLEPLRAS